MCARKYARLMASNASRDLFYSTPLRRQNSTPRKTSVAQSPSTSGDTFRQMFRAMEGMSEQINDLKRLVEQQNRDIKQNNEEIQQLREIIQSDQHRGIGDLGLQQLGPGSAKRLKRANNVHIAVSGISYDSVSTNSSNYFVF